MTARVMLQSLIEKFPGMYFQQIVRASSMPIGTVDYNLWKLQKDKAIKSEIIFGKKRFFEISFENPRMYGLLQEEIVRRIVKLITIGKHTNSAISKELKLSKSTISWYLKRISNEGLTKEFILENQNILDIPFSKSSAVDNFISMWEK